MTDKELKRLSRGELLEMLIAQSKEMKQMQEWLKQVEAKLAAKEIAIEEAGSIAEASLVLNGVFGAVQAAGEQYLDNIRNLSQRQEQKCADMEQECNEKIALQLAQTQAKCDAMEQETKAKCEAMVANAQAEAQAYWDEVSVKLEAYYQENESMRKLLSVMMNQ